MKIVVFLCFFFTIYIYIYIYIQTENPRVKRKVRSKNAQHFCYLRNGSLPEKISASLAAYRNRTLEETLGNSYCKLTVFS